MVDEKETKPEETEPEAEEIIEEKVIEIPADLDSFFKTLMKARNAISKAQENLGANVTYEATQTELEGLNKTLKDIEARVRQLSDLEGVLASTKFTTKDSVDAEIRKRVIEQLTKNFKFERIGVQAEVANLVPTDDIEIAPLPKKTLKTENLPPARDLRSVREEARADAASELRRAGIDVGMYERAANAQHGDVEGMQDLPDLSSLPDLDGLTQEEIKEAFPDMDPALVKKVEQLKKIAPKRMSGNKLGGITRRE